jgi:hypothetical protein
VDGAIDVRQLAGEPEHVGDVTDHGLGAGLGRRLRLLFAAHQGTHLVAVLAQRPQHVSADVAGRTGEQHVHLHTPIV